MGIPKSLENNMSDKPNIVYFPARGRAELTRIVLATAGVEWSETTIDQDSIKEWKANGSLAFGQVPLLQIDGFNDLLNKLIPCLYPSFNQEKLDAFKVDSLPPFLTAIENILTKNEGGKGFVSGNTLSLGDLVLFSIVESFVDDYSLVDKSSFAILYAHKERIAAVPNVSNYISSEKRYPARKLGPN